MIGDRKRLDRLHVIEAQLKIRCNSECAEVLLRTLRNLETRVAELESELEKSHLEGKS